MTGTTATATRSPRLLPGAATSLLVNLVISLTAWFGTFGDEQWFPAVAVTMLVTSVVGVGLLASPRWRRFGVGVLAGAGIAFVLNAAALTALGLALGS